MGRQPTVGSRCTRRQDQVGCSQPHRPSTAGRCARSLQLETAVAKSGGRRIRHGDVVTARHRVRATGSGDGQGHAVLAGDVVGVAWALQGRGRSIAKVPIPAGGSTGGVIGERNGQGMQTRRRRTTEARGKGRRTTRSVVNQQGEVLVSTVPIPWNAVAAYGRGSHRNRECPGGSRRQEHDLGVVTHISGTAGGGGSP